MHLVGIFFGGNWVCAWYRLAKWKNVMGPDVVSGQEVPDRGVTAPPRPELVEAGGRSMTGRIVGVTAPPRPELIEAGGRSVARLHLGRN